MKRNPHDEVYWTEEQQKAPLSGVRSNELLYCPFTKDERKSLRCDLLHELWSVVGDIVCRRDLLPYVFKDTIEKAKRIFDERAS